MAPYPFLNCCDADMTLTFAPGHSVAVYCMLCGMPLRCSGMISTVPSPLVSNAPPPTPCRLRVDGTRYVIMSDLR